LAGFRIAFNARGQKMVRNPQNKLKQKKGYFLAYDWLFTLKEGSQQFLTQLLVCFAHICYMSDYQKCTSVESCAETTRKNSGAETSQTTVVFISCCPRPTHTILGGIDCCTRPRSDIIRGMIRMPCLRSRTCGGSSTAGRFTRGGVLGARSSEADRLSPAVRMRYVNRYFKKLWNRSHCHSFGDCSARIMKAAADFN
jgi:hypothetical protein